MIDLVIYLAKIYMEAITQIELNQKKAKLPAVKVGDTVRIHQKITEGKKSRVQIFEGLVIRYRKVNSLQAFITVRKIASGVGVEKSWFVHNPTIEKIQVVKRSKVRRAFLSYMRDRSGKSARLAEMGFDKDTINEADSRTKSQIVAEEAQKEQENIRKEIDQGADKAAKDDVLNSDDTASTDDVAKEEDKQAAKEDPNPAEDNVPADAPAQEKINSDGNDEQQEAAEEAQEGVDRDNK